MNQQGRFKINQQGQFKWPRQNPPLRQKPTRQNPLLRLKLKKFLHDPSWQFVGVLIALIIGIPSILLTHAASQTPQSKSIMHIYQQNVSFNYNICDQPLKQTIDIINAGGDTLKWITDTPSEPWLRVSPIEGNVNPGKSDVLWLYIVPSGLTNGTYRATIDITSQDGDYYTITATLSISLPSPGCQLSVELR